MIKSFKGTLQFFIIITNSTNRNWNTLYYKIFIISAVLKINMELLNIYHIFPIKI